MSHVMKTLERLVLQHLRPLVGYCLDPLQFVYQIDISMEDLFFETYCCADIYSPLYFCVTWVRVYLQMGINKGTS